MSYKLNNLVPLSKLCYVIIVCNYNGNQSVDTH